MHLADDPPPHTPPPRHWGRGVLYVALCVVWVGPLWVSELPPSVDYPQHLLQVAILKGVLAQAPGYENTYILALNRPQTLFEYTACLFSVFVPINVAGKLTLSLFVAGLAAACLLLVRHTGRPAWYAWIGASGIYGYCFYWGMVGNLAGYALLVAGAVLVDRFFARPLTARRWLILALYGLSFYFAHLLMFFLYVGVVGWLALVRVPSPRRLMSQLSTLLPGAFVVAIYVLAVSGQHTPTGSYLVTDGAQWIVPSYKLVTLAGFTFGAHADQAELTVAAILLLVLVAPLIGRPGRARRRTARDVLFCTRFMSLSLWMLVLYMLLPMAIGAIGLLYGRFAAPILFFAGAALPRPAGRGKARVVLVLVGAMAFVQLRATSQACRTFDEESRPLLTLVDAAGEGKTVLAVLEDTHSAGVREPPLFLNAVVYYQAFRGGRVGYSSADLYQFIARYRPELRWDDLIEVTYVWDTVDTFDYARHGARFDCFLLRTDPSRQDALFARLFGEARTDLTQTRLGSWVLVERR